MKLQSVFYYVDNIFPITNLLISNSKYKVNTFYLLNISHVFKYKIQVYDNNIYVRHLLFTFEIQYFKNK